MADTDNIAYDFAQLNHAADSCKSAVSNMTSTLGDLESTCKALLGSWSGDAQGAYHQRQREWDQASSDLKTLLTGIEGALREAASQMQAAEQKNLQRFGNG